MLMYFFYVIQAVLSILNSTFKNTFKFKITVENKKKYMRIKYIIFISFDKMVFIT